MNILNQAANKKGVTDTVSPEKRSWNMSRVRSKHTKPELVMRSLLHRAGFRFSLRSKLLGSPDIVLPKYKTVIFVHGCFWHRHEHCAKARMPSSNQDYWRKKFVANTARDQAVRQELEQQRWRVLVLWECEIMRDPAAVCAETIRALTGDGHKKYAPLKLTRKEILQLAEHKRIYYAEKGKKCL